MKSYLAQFAARAIVADLINIAELAHQVENGAHFPLFLLCLQQLVKLKDREWLSDLFQQSKINMQKMLPGMSHFSYVHILMLRLLLLLMSFPVEVDQNKDRMLEILEGKGLSFLFPLMRLEKELLKQIKVDPSPQSIYKWIKENVSPKLHTDKGFVNILMTRYSTKTCLCTVSSVVFFNYLLLSVSCSIFHMRSALTMRMSSLWLPVKSSWMKRNNFCCPSSQ